MNLLTVEEALNLISTNTNPVGEEIIPASSGLGRILSRGLSAKHTQPPFSASAMDGYAVRSDDLNNIPINLLVTGESSAGKGFKGEVKRGEAIRIFTGAPIPQGADTIIIQENTRIVGNKIQVIHAEKSGRYIRNAGLDFTKGACLLKTGKKITPAVLALVISMNHTKISVFRQPKIAIISTGNELASVGTTLKPDQIIASNAYGIYALTIQAGGIPLDLGIARDNKKSLDKLINDAFESGADIIVTLGGISVGDHDLVRTVMQAKGFAIKFTGIAMRPGKPMTFGKRDKTYFLGLPGNPVSSFMTAMIFLQPLIHLLAGEVNNFRKPIDAQLVNPLGSNDERQEYMRGIAKYNSNKLIVVKTFENQDSSILSNLAKANCLVIRKPHAKPAKPGDPCKIIQISDF